MRNIIFWITFFSMVLLNSCFYRGLNRKYYTQEKFYNVVDDWYIGMPTAEALHGSRDKELNKTHYQYRISLPLKYPDWGEIKSAVKTGSFSIDSIDVRLFPTDTVLSASLAHWEGKPKTRENICINIYQGYASSDYLFLVTEELTIPPGTDSISVQIQVTAPSSVDEHVQRYFSFVLQNHEGRKLFLDVE